MRLIVYLLLFAGTILGIYSTQDSVCQPQPNEELIWEYEVRRPYKIRAHQETEADYGPTRAIITCIEIHSLTDSEDADVWVTSGGVGQNFVKLKFKSKLSRGFVYKVSVYGRVMSVPR
ncbi:uncharacterized protein [Prorops nasuta]|uniref:uncharacterized protein n=1 Tax=Prorops nasuta TaxID=863751 RepID=UPI0034CDCFF0